MSSMLSLLRNNSSRYRFDQFSEEEIERNAQEEPGYTHYVLWYEEDNEYHGRRDIERFTDESRIEEISLNQMDNKEHDDDRGYDAPTSICWYTSKEDRYTSDKNS